VWITAGPLAVIQWIHRLLAYSLAIAPWSGQCGRHSADLRSSWGWSCLQIGIGAAIVLLGLPSGLRAAHVAVGAAVWSGIVLASR